MAGFWFNLKANKKHRVVSWLAFFFFLILKKKTPDFKLYYDCFGPEFTFEWLVEMGASVRGTTMDSRS